MTTIENRPHTALLVVDVQKGGTGQDGRDGADAGRRLRRRLLRVAPAAYSYQQPMALIEFHSPQLLVLPSLSVPGGQGHSALSGFPAQKEALQ